MASPQKILPIAAAMMLFIGAGRAITRAASRRTTARSCGGGCRLWAQPDDPDQAPPFVKALQIVQELIGRRLADVDKGAAAQMVSQRLQYPQHFRANGIIGA